MTWLEFHLWTGSGMGTRFGPHLEVMKFLAVMLLAYSCICAQGPVSTLCLGSLWDSGVEPGLAPCQTDKSPAIIYFWPLKISTALNFYTIGLAVTEYGSRICPGISLHILWLFQQLVCGNNFVTQHLEMPYAVTLVSLCPRKWGPL